MTDITVTESVAGIDSVLTRNRAFAAADGHEGASLFPDLGLHVVTCLDARVDPRTHPRPTLAHRNRGRGPSSPTTDETSGAWRDLDAVRPSRTWSI